MECEVCGVSKEDAEVINSRKHEAMLCRRHYSQMEQYGRILSRTVFDKNGIIEKDDLKRMMLNE